MLAYMLLHVEVPAVIRLAIKCAKVFFKLVDLRKLKLFYSETDAEQNAAPPQPKDLLDGSHLPEDQSDFLTEAFRTIGARITNSRHLSEQQRAALSAQESAGPRAMDSLRSIPSISDDDAQARNRTAPPEPEQDQVGNVVAPKASAQAEDVQLAAPDAGGDKQAEAAEEKQIDTTAPVKKEREYFVYANVNIPREEDFVFLVTALWHWYQKHLPPGLQLYSDPDEMEVEEVPPEEKKQEAKKEEKKIDLSDPDTLSDDTEIAGSSW